MLSPRILPLLLAALVLSSVAASALGAPSAVRVSGESPVAYSVALSQQLFADAGEPGATAVHAVIGREDSFADSLAAGPLLNGGPLLFVPGGEDGELPGEIAAELQRILPPASTVYLAGGEAAVSVAIEEGVAALGFIDVRLAGAERTETAAAIAEESERLHGPADRVLVALATDWPDAVAGGAVAASELVPVLLTDGESLSAAAAEGLAAAGPAEVVVLGGVAVITDEVATAAGADRRIAGSTRAHTAAGMIDLFGDDVTGTTVAQGFTDDGWIWGNPAAAVLEPLLLNGPDADSLNPVVRQALPGRTGPLFVLGGTDRMSEAAAAEAEAAR